jgi:hypothetical protein
MRKLTALVTSVALVAAMSSTPAFADTVPTPGAAETSGDTLAAMQAQCDTIAASYDTGDGDIWTGEVVEGAVTLVSGPTEVPGTRIIDESTIVGSGVFTPAALYIEGEPYRIGGSVNMFGDARTSAGSWSESTYDFTADFDSTFSHAFNCNIYQQDYHPEQTIHHNAEGVYVIAGDFGDSEAAIRGNCAAFTAQGDNDPQPDWFGDPFHGGSDANPHCQFEGTPAYDEVIPESWDDPALIASVAGVAVDQDQTDSLLGFEDHGGSVEVSGDFFVGQVVICISPKKPTPGGTWQTQNGYTGTNCNTAYFNSAPWGGGSQTSNGTYISVPAI